MYLPKHLSFVQSVEFVWGPSHGSSFSNPLSGHISSFGNSISGFMVVASGLGTTTHFLWRILLQPRSKMMQSPNDPHSDQPHSISVLICHIRNNGNCNVRFFVYYINEARPRNQNIINVTYRALLSSQ